MDLPLRGRSRCGTGGASAEGEGCAHQRGGEASRTRPKACLIRIAALYRALTAYVSFVLVGGRSPWRALYRQIGGEFVVAAIGPEAQTDPRGFAAACRRAEARLAEIKDEA